MFKGNTLGAFLLKSLGATGAHGKFELGRRV